MGLLTSLLNLFGCNRHKQPDSASDSALDSNTIASIEAFQNRTIHRVLTTSIIDSTADEELLQAVFDNLSANMGEDYTKEYETLMSWNDPRRAIYMIWLLEAEVNNGGHNQFYYNSSGQFYEHLPKALRLVGAERHAELMERANKTYEQEYKKITEHLDGTIEGFSKSYDDNPLNPLDKEFYALESEENLWKIQTAFIRENKEDFVDSQTNFRK